MPSRARSSCGYSCLWGSGAGVAGAGVAFMTLSIMSGAMESLHIIIGAGPLFEGEVLSGGIDLAVLSIMGHLCGIEASLGTGAGAAGVARGATVSGG